MQRSSGIVGIISDVFGTIRSGVGGTAARTFTATGIALATLTGCGGTTHVTRTPAGVAMSLSPRPAPCNPPIYHGELSDMTYVEIAQLNVSDANGIVAIGSATVGRKLTEPACPL